MLFVWVKPGNLRFYITVFFQLLTHLIKLMMFYASFSQYISKYWLKLCCVTPCEPEYDSIHSNYCHYLSSLYGYSCNHKEFSHCIPVLTSFTDLCICLFPLVKSEMMLKMKLAVEGGRAHLHSPSSYLNTNCYETSLVYAT